MSPVEKEWVGAGRGPGSLPALASPHQQARSPLISRFLQAWEAVRIAASLPPTHSPGGSC